MGQPIYNNLVADYAPEGWLGRMYGISFFCSFGIGSFSASFLGYIGQQLNTSWIFTTMAFISAINLVFAAVLLVRALRQSRLRKLS